MWDRYKPIAIVAGVIFLANIIVRILGVTVYRKSDNGQINSGLVFLAALAIVMLVAAYWWSVRFPLVAGAARARSGAAGRRRSRCVLIGPMFSGALSRLHHPKVSAEPVRRRRRASSSPRSGTCSASASAARSSACLAAMAIGKDYRAQQLKRFTKTVASKPHRAVRR